MKPFYPIRLPSKTSWALAAMLSTSTLWAQNLPTPPATPHASPQHQEHRPARPGPHHQEHLKALKSKLQLRADQDGAWTAFASAMSAQPQRPAPSAHRQELAQLSTPERVDRMRALRQERQAAMSALADQRGEATKTFYAQLDPEQKRIFDDETARRMAHRGERGMRHHRG